MHLPTRFCIFAAALMAANIAHAQVPGYVPPVTMTQAPDYADDTRGVFVPEHNQYRLQTEQELYQNPRTAQVSQSSAQDDEFEREMNRIANGINNSATPAPAPGGQMPYNPAMQGGYGPSYGQPYAPNYGQQPQQPAMQPQQGAPYNNAMAPMQPVMGGSMVGGQGVEIAVGQGSQQTVDLQNALVRLREDKITIRRTLQRMMDQAGASDWKIMWDLSETNAALPDMEISIDAHEPFNNVLNALLARMQTRSGQPLRVIRYDNNRQLVVTDRVSGHRLASEQVSTIGSVGAGQDPLITERVLKETLVSLHYDEIPLVDALESVVNQAGKGQWRLRVYAGLDQVLKPAHIEEPFSVAMERLLRLFNLKYEIFPGGKLVVVTQNNRFGFGSLKQ